MGASGTTTVDFGTFPGATDATVTVTGQILIAAGSLVEAWIRPVATADHTADEHMLEPLRVFAHSIVAGTGFSISAFAVGNPEPVDPPEMGMGRESAWAGPGQADWQAPRSAGGIGHRAYGQFTVAWVWN